MSKSSFLLGVAALSALAGSALAEPSIRTNGFITAGFSLADTDEKYVGVGDHANFDDVSRMAVQFQFDPGVELPITFTTQLLARGRGDWQVDAEWAYISYQLSDATEIRGGKIRLPMLMLSETYDVGLTYPWINPPEELYGFANVPFTSISGASVYHTFDFDESTLSAQLYTGQGSPSVQISGLEVDVVLEQMIGIVLNWSTDSFAFRVSGHRGHFTDNSLESIADAAHPFLEATSNAVPAAFPFPIVTIQDTQRLLVLQGVENATNGKVEMITAGTSMDWNNIIGYAEVAKRRVINSLFPTTTNWYVTLGYRFGALMPHISHSKFDTSNSAFEQGQNTTTLGLVYQTSPASNIKIEYAKVSIDPGSTGLMDVLVPAFGGPTSLEDPSIIRAAFNMVF